MASTVTPGGFRQLHRLHLGVRLPGVGVDGQRRHLVLLFATLGYFFPQFEGGTTLLAIIGASVLLWIVHS